MQPPEIKWLETMLKVMLSGAFIQFLVGIVRAIYEEKCILESCLYIALTSAVGSVTYYFLNTTGLDETWRVGLTITMTISAKELIEFSIKTAKILTKNPLKLFGFLISMFYTRPDTSLLEDESPKKCKKKKSED